MKPISCQYEAAVLEAIHAPRWPERCDADLLAHVNQCPVCADIVLVAQEIERASQTAVADISVPPAGLVWWKAQLKARREAVKRASEPIALVERLAAVFGAAVIIALGIWQWDRVLSWFSWLGGTMTSGAPSTPATRASEIGAYLSSLNLLLAASVIGCLLLGSVVLYFVLDKES